MSRRGRRCAQKGATPELLNVTHITAFLLGGGMLN